MKIAETSNSIKSVISQHHVYGAEVIMNSIAYACYNEPYLGREQLHELLDRALEKVDDYYSRCEEYK